MEERHAVFGFVEKRIGEVLLPNLGPGGGHVAEPDHEEVHVQRGDLEPGVEGGGETEGWGYGLELAEMGETEEGGYTHCRTSILILDLYLRQLRFWVLHLPSQMLVGLCSRLAWRTL